MTTRQPQIFDAPEITFLGEQNGPAEHRLKQALATMMRSDATVVRAYLVRVLYDGTEANVLLAMLTDTDDESEQLVKQASAAFASIFNAQAHLDMVFLTDERDAELRRVCPPFYQRNGTADLRDRLQ
jgi:hypothetical protein